MGMTSTSDTSTRFLFTEADVRGESVRLDQSFKELVGDHGYSVSTTTLLGQFAAAAVLISNNLKYRGRIILQARSEAALSLVMVECSSDRQLRGIARGAVDVEAEEPFALIANGQLALTIEREGGQRHQGIVGLEAECLASALSDYFLHSEQLHTRFYLESGPDLAAGLMLQQLPTQIIEAPEHRAEQWHHITTLADTVTKAELLELDPLTLLHRLYHEHILSVFAAQPVVFECSCSRQRSLDALSLLPVQELNEALADTGDITMTCEMCGTAYRFTRSDLPTLAEHRILH